jgi:hypothetical protein
MTGVRPLLALGAGAAALVVAPVEEARGGRLGRGLRRGAAQFAAAVAAEARGLRAGIAAGSRAALEAAARFDDEESALGGAHRGCSL